MQLEDRNVIVTEAADGARAATVTTLIHRGARVFAIDIDGAPDQYTRRTRKCSWSPTARGSAQCCGTHSAACRRLVWCD